MSVWAQIWTWLNSEAHVLSTVSFCLLTKTAFSKFFWLGPTVKKNAFYIKAWCIHTHRGEMSFRKGNLSQPHRVGSMLCYSISFEGQFWLWPQIDSRTHSWVPACSLKSTKGKGLTPRTPWCVSKHVGALSPRHLGAQRPLHQPRKCNHPNSFLPSSASGGRCTFTPRANICWVPSKQKKNKKACGIFWETKKGIKVLYSW